MINFLQHYIKNDFVGSIANAHLAHADKQGIFSAISKNIASKFSISIDFAKNGKSEHVGLKQRPHEYPDFMENALQDMYKSKKVLGKMYRLCKDFESESQAESVSYENVKVNF